MRFLEAWILVGALGLLSACAGDKPSTDNEDLDDSGKAQDEKAEDKAPPPPPVAPPTPSSPVQADAPPPPPPQAVAAAPAAAAAPGLTFDGPKVTRFIRTVAVKIHKDPTKDSEVVGWVHRGAKVDVVINGDWAKLDSGHFISSKFLVEKAP